MSDLVKGRRGETVRLGMRSSNRLGVVPPSWLSRTTFYPVRLTGVGEGDRSWGSPQGYFREELSGDPTVDSAVFLRGD